MSGSSLQAVENELKQNGMKDVKFLFKRESFGAPLSDVEDDLADVLKKFRAGHYTVVDKLPSEELTA